jgi:hypothetical protein
MALARAAQEHLQVRQFGVGFARSLNEGHANTSDLVLSFSTRHVKLHDTVSTFASVNSQVGSEIIYQLCTIRFRESGGTIVERGMMTSRRGEKPCTSWL